MRLIEFFKPDPVKLITALLLSLLIFYVAITNIGVTKCTNEGCPKIQSTFINKIILYFSLWPLMLFSYISYALFNERNWISVYASYILEVIYSYILVCVASHFVKKRI